jgi:hypothetical protein
MRLMFKKIAAREKNRILRRIHDMRYSEGDAYLRTIRSWEFELYGFADTEDAQRAYEAGWHSALAQLRLDINRGDY